MAGDKPLLIDQPIARAIRLVALPAVGSMLVRFTNHAVDQFWIGRLSHAAEALAAIASANFLVWAVYSQAALFTTGLQALVSRAVGSQDPAAKARAEKHGLALALLLGVAVCALGLVSLDWILRFQEVAPQVRVLAKQYLTIILAGLPISYVGLAIETIYAAEGDTRTPFRLATLALVGNFLLDPLLIRGAGPIPSLGIVGAALATVGVQLFQMLALLWLHTRKERLVRVRFEVTQWFRFLQLGVPVAVSGTLFSLIYIALVRILSPFGTAPVAALGLGHTIEGLPHFLCVGFSMAAATLVGQNLGADRPDAAGHAGWQVVWTLTRVLIPVALGYGLFAGPLLAIFMNPPDADVIRYGQQYLWAAAVAQVWRGWELVLLNAMNGAGYTVVPNVVDTAILMLRLPLAWWLAQRLGMGPWGVWLSIGSMMVVGAVAMALLFRSGAWRHRPL